MFFGHQSSNLLSHAPIWFLLFYLRGVVDKVVETKDMYRGVILFIGIQAVVLAVVFFFPEVLDVFVVDATGEP